MLAKNTQPIENEEQFVSAFGVSQSMIVLSERLRRSYGVEVTPALGEIRHVTERWELCAQDDDDGRWTLMSGKQPHGPMRLPQEVPVYVRDLFKIDSAGNIPLSKDEMVEHSSVVKVTYWYAHADNTLRMRCHKGRGMTLVLQVTRNITRNPKHVRGVFLHGKNGIEELAFPFSMERFLKAGQFLTKKL